MTLMDKVMQLRRQVIQRAAAGIPVTRVCREAGISRTLFYRWKQGYLRYGDRGRQSSPALAHAVLAYALQWPTHGPHRIADQLRQRRYGGWRLSATGASKILRRPGLGTRGERLARLEGEALGPRGSSPSGRYGAPAYRGRAPRRAGMLGQLLYREPEGRGAGGVAALGVRCSRELRDRAGDARRPAGAGCHGLLDRARGARLLPRRPPGAGRADRPRRHAPLGVPGTGRMTCPQRMHKCQHPVEPGHPSSYPQLNRTRFP